MALGSKAVGDYTFGKKYNGTGDKAQRYGEYVREYFPDMKEYLE